MLVKLREFVHCRTEISWDQMRRAAEDKYALTVNKAWASPTAPAESTGVLNAKTAGPFHTAGDVIVGTGSRPFCEAVKTLIEEGVLQVLVDGRMQYAVDPVTGYAYGDNPRSAPMIPELKATISLRNTK